MLKTFTHSLLRYRFIVHSNIVHRTFCLFTLSGKREVYYKNKTLDQINWFIFRDSEIIANKAEIGYTREKLCAVLRLQVMSFKRTTIFEIVSPDIYIPVDSKVCRLLKQQWLANAKHFFFAKSWRNVAAWNVRDTHMFYYAAHDIILRSLFTMKCFI